MKSPPTIEFVLEEMYSGFDQMTVWHESHVKRLYKVEIALSGVKDRLEHIEVRLDSIETRLESLGNRMDLLEARMYTLEFKVDSIDSKIDKLIDLFQDVRNEQIFMKSRLDRAEQRLLAGGL